MGSEEVNATLTRVERPTRSMRKPSRSRAAAASAGSWARGCGAAAAVRPNRPAAHRRSRRRVEELARGAEANSVRPSSASVAATWCIASGDFISSMAPSISGSPREGSRPGSTVASSGWRNPTIRMAWAVKRSGRMSSEKSPIASTGRNTRRNSQCRRQSMRAARSMLPRRSGGSGDASSGTGKVG